MTSALAVVKSAWTRTVPTGVRVAVPPAVVKSAWMRMGADRPCASLSLWLW
jgi:hypothetical protein